MMDFFFQTSYPLKYRIGGTLGGIFIAVSAFGPTWAIPFNRYWVNIYRENGKKGPTAYGAGKGYAWNYVFSDSKLERTLFPNSIFSSFFLTFRKPFS